jgi:hypothetical protein
MPTGIPITPTAREADCLALLRSGRPWGISEGSELRVAVLTHGTAEDRKNLYGRSAYCTCNDEPVGLSDTGVSDIGKALWDVDRPELMPEFLKWLQAAPGATPKRTSQMWHIVAQGQGREARSPACIEAWVQAKLVLASPGGKAPSAGKMSREDALMNYAIALAEDHTYAGTLSPAFVLSSQPHRLAGVVDLLLQPHFMLAGKRSGFLGERVRDRALARRMQNRDKLGEDVYLARFSGEEPVEPPLAAGWLCQGVVSGIGIPTLEHISARQPKVWEHLSASPATVHEALADLTVNTDQSDPRETAARADWFLRKVEPSAGVKERVLAKEVLPRASIPLAEVLLTHLGPKTFGCAEKGALTWTMGPNPLLASWLVRRGVFPVSALASSLAGGAPLGTDPLAPSSIQASAEVAAIPLSEGERHEFAKAATQTPLPSVHHWLKQQGHVPNWSTLDVLLDPDILSSAHSADQDLVAARAREIAAGPREADSRPVAAALQRVMADMLKSRPDDHWPTSNPEVHALLKRMQSAREGGVTVEPADLSALQAEGSILNPACRYHNSQHPTWRDAIAAEVAEWAGEPRGTAFVETLASCGHVQQIRAANAGWLQRMGNPPPVGLYGRTCYGVRAKTLSHSLEALTTENPATDFSAKLAQTQYAYNLTCLFGTPDRISRYVSSVGGSCSRAAQFEVPLEPGWAQAAWGDAALKHGPKMARFVRFAQKDIAPPVSLNAARKEFAGRAYVGGEDSPEIARLCLELDLTQSDFDRVCEANRKVEKATASAEVPAVVVDGDKFGLPGYLWHRAEVGDPRILVAGHLVNCCQHVSGQAADATLHSATSPHGACFFLEKKERGLTARGDVIAASWCWKSGPDELCVDSFEHINPDENQTAPQFVRLMSAFRDEVKANHPSIASLTIGKGGRTPVVPLPEATPALEPKDFAVGYRDSHVQYALISRDKAVDLAVAKELQAEHRSRKRPWEAAEHFGED